MARIGVAITGAAGFLGTHLVRGFEARGASVLPLVRAVDGRSPLGARVLDSALESPSILAECDVVVHAAAVGQRQGIDASTYRTSNVALVERAVRAAAAAGARRFVLISSAGVYGFPSRLPVTEEHPYAPRTRYAATKVEAEMRARRSARDLALDLCIVRPTIVYGPGDRNGMLGKMAALMRSSAYRIVGTGDNILHHTYVDDIVEGTWLAATHPRAAGDHFILGGPETTTLKRLSELVARAVGRPLPRRHVPAGLARVVATVVDVAVNRRSALVARDLPVNHETLDIVTLSLCFDTRKARRRLGFSARVGYEEGVMRTLRGIWPPTIAAASGGR